MNEIRYHNKLTTAISTIERNAEKLREQLYKLDQRKASLNDTLSGINCRILERKIGEW